MEGYGNGGAQGFASPIPQFLGGHTSMSKGDISNMNAPTPRQPHVSSEIERLSKVTEHLHQIIGMLEERVSSVMMPAPPEGQQGGGTSPTLPVPLAAGLAVLNVRVEVACQRLSSLVARIEL